MINGTAAGGGYELALAADHIMLVDDGSSAVALPEVPLLAVLPGTGGLTRVTDKRKVRRDHADVFCTIEEGIKGRRAVEWRLVDEIVPRSRVEEKIAARVDDFRARSTRPAGGEGHRADAASARDRARPPALFRASRSRSTARPRVTTVTVHGPDAPPPADVDGLVAEGAESWMLRAARELDDAILHLRLNERETAVIQLKTLGDPALAAAHDRFIDENQDHWLAREIRHLWKRVLKRVDLTSRTLVAVIEPGSCFSGTLAELAFAADRSYMLVGRFEGDNRAGRDADARRRELRPVPDGERAHPARDALPRHAGGGGRPRRPPSAARSRPRKPKRSGSSPSPSTTSTGRTRSASSSRSARASRRTRSPAWRRTCASAGPETMETKIFARLTAWQNWIFQRPNAVGPEGALRRYGTGQKAAFDMGRV